MHHFPAHRRQGKAHKLDCVAQFLKLYDIPLFLLSIPISARRISHTDMGYFSNTETLFIVRKGNLFRTKRTLPKL